MRTLRQNIAFIYLSPYTTYTFGRVRKDFFTLARELELEAIPPDARHSRIRMPTRLYPSSWNFELFKIFKQNSGGITRWKEDTYKNS